MTELERFVEVVNASDIDLGRAAALIAAVVRPPVDVVAVLGELDSIAARCVVGGFDELRRVLFVDIGFRGNVARYDDPENSFLDAVLRRRVGIPISLAILMIEVGRRVGVTLDPISMPGHFLVQERVTQLFCDPFNGGALLDAGGCRVRHDELFGGRRVLQPHELAPVASPLVLARVLNNLEQSRLGQDPDTLATLLTMHAGLPLLPAGEHLAIATRFAVVGRFGAAGAAASRAAALLEGPEQQVALRMAAQYWGNTN